ncbi:MAG: AAA family ATPase [Desulfobacteraceae bacterium]|jgi:type II secretory pathway predicted ATPase ExeA/cell division septation protein DedD|nr:AAA family ATPase [Desulfobacteraceae bacterium]
MFLPYFNFKENPFNLTIDLAYLYLGHHHEEANAHLTYAVSEGEGFIVITGERGVGKTTVCRSFLEGLGKDVETAYIDRSTSNPQKLLLYINAEFKIRSKTATIKDLADALNEFLMQKKIEGKKVAVFIDDAHQLNSDVLEQVRLISNLETTKDKLLQLVLIGEPKLSVMLNSNELRQIGQRVSVGYCIDPLTYDETVGYIQHRLTMASKGPPIRFAPKAVRRIFKYSRGIPRYINIACARALEIAYQRKFNHIDSDIAKATIRYLSDRAETGKSKSRNRRLTGSIAAICCLIFVTAMAVFYFRYNDDQNSSEKVIAVKKIPLATGLSTEMPVQSVLPSPVDPEPSATKEELPIEPVQPDPPAGPTETTDGSDVEQGSVPMMAAQTVPAESSVSSSDSADLEQGSVPMETPTVPAESSVPFFDSSDVEQKSAPMTHSVQVGAFRRTENADDLIAQLAVKGYLAQIVEIPDSQGRLWFTVRIGDHPTLESAEKQAGMFMEAENMRAFVRPYNAF